MARTNVSPASAKLTTHEGGTAKHISATQELERSVMSCLLWEDGFYESGVDIAERIKLLAVQVGAVNACDIALRARRDHGLRHVPLWIVAALANAGLPVSADLVEAICDRPDQMGELVAMLWGGSSKPEGVSLSAQVKKGLARAFVKFDEYALAKYDRSSASISLLDIMRLVHPKPIDETQAAVFGRLRDGELATPDTWETALSGGADKRQTFERLIAEEKLGALALIRNLRKMTEVGVPRDVIQGALNKANVSRIFPFQFIAAAIHAPQFEPELEDAMFRACESIPKLAGHTAIVVDVSASMTFGDVSGRSQMTYSDAATALAMMAREICEDVTCIAYGSLAEIVPSRRGYGLRDVIRNANVGHATNMHLGIQMAIDSGATRVICFSDEQAYTRLQDPPKDVRGYVVNVATAKNGLGYGPWMHFDGFSSAFLKFVAATEAADADQ